MASNGQDIDLTALLPPEIDLTQLLPPTTGDKAKALGSLVVQGAAGVPASMLETAAAGREMLGLTGMGLGGLLSTDQLRAGAAGIMGLAGATMPSNVQADDLGFAGDLAQGIGSGIGFLVPGGALTKLGMKAGTAFAGLGVGVEAGTAYYEARAHGASPEGQALAFLGGSLGGATEGLGGLARVLGRMDAKLGGRFLSSLASTMLEEGGQEAVQGAIHDAFAQFLHDDPEAHAVFSAERAREFVVGSLVGAIFQTGANVLARAGGQTPDSDADETGPAKPVKAGPGLSGADKPGLSVPQEQAGAAAAEAGTEATGPAVAGSRTPAAPIPPGLLEGFTERNRGALKKRGLELGEVRAVEADPARPAETWLQEAGRSLGLNVQMVDGGQALPLPSVYQGRTVLMDRNAKPAEHIRRLLYHEAAHAARMEAPDVWRPAWEEVQRLDPTGTAEAGADYAASWAEETGEVLTPDALEDETGAHYAEMLGGYLDEALTNPERLEALTATPEGRTFLQRILDALRRIVGRLTGRQMPSLARDLAALKDELARTPTEKRLEPATAARIALTLRAGLKGLETLPRIEAQPAASQEATETVTKPSPEPSQGAFPEPAAPVLEESPEAPPEPAPAAGVEPEAAPSRKREPTRATPEDPRFSAAPEGFPEDLADDIRLQAENRRWTKALQTEGARVVFDDGREGVIVRPAEDPDNGDRPLVRFKTRERNYQGEEYGDEIEVVQSVSPYSLSPAPNPFAPRFAVAPRTDSPEFKRWFGDSKVVDGEGSPLVVYHGTDADFTAFSREKLGRVWGDRGFRSTRLGFFFTDDTRVAEYYARQAAAKEDTETSGDGARILPVYVSIKRPLEPSAIKTGEPLDVSALMAQGYDGIVLEHDFIAFRPEQVKSATGNLGTYDPSDPDIRFAVAAPDGTASFDAPDRSLSDKARTALVYNMERLDVLERAAGVSEADSARRAFDLLDSKSQGKTKRQRAEFQRLILNPLKAAKAPREAFEEYLNARHAPDANEEQIRKDETDKTPGKHGHEFNPGSGMKTSEAARIRKAVESGPHAELFVKLADRMDALRDKNLARMVEAGLIGQDTADAWKERFGPHYIPLATVGGPEDADVGVSRRSLQTRGEESKRRKGRKSLANDILAQVLFQHQQTTWRAFRNEFGRKLAGIVDQHPNADVWETADSLSAIDPKAVTAGKVFGYKEAGEQKYLVLHDAALAEQVRRMEANPGDLLRMMQSAASVMKRLHTSWNVAFFAPNFFRDVGMAAATLTAEESAAFARAALDPRRLGKNMRQMFQVLRDPTTEGALLAKQFIEDGGQTDWAPAPSIQRTVEEVNKALQEQDAKGFKAALQGIGSVLESASSAIENAVRLSVYETALERGYSRDKAALMAKDVTVNFGRKGTWSSTLGALYLFFNPGVQGTAKIARLFTNPKARGPAAALSAGIFASGFLVAAINRALGGDDEDGFNRWDSVEPYQFERQFVLVTQDGKQLRLPLPWGFNVLFFAGAMAERVAFGAEDPAKATSEIARAALQAFTPIGGEATLAQNVSPWFLDPAVKQGENKTWYGAPIKPTGSPYDQAPPPDSTMFWPTVNPAARATAAWLNRVTGGNEIVPGTVDVSPEILEHWTEFVFGGTGRTLGRGMTVAQKIMAGEADDISLNQLPVLNRFLGETDARFLRTEMREAESRIAYEKKKQRARLPFDRRLVVLEGRLKLAEKQVERARERGDEEAEERARRAFVKAYREAK